MAPPTRRNLIARAAALLALPACAVPTDTDDTDDTDDPSPDPDDTDDSAAPKPWCEVTAGTEAEGWRPVSLADHPELATVGGFVQLSVGGQTLNLVQVEADCFVAMGTVCTHAGCTVTVRSGPRFVCPCHGAVYNFEGRPVSGPAPTALPTWPAAARDGSVWVKVG